MEIFELLHKADQPLLLWINRYLADPWNDFILKIWSAEAPWFVLTAFFLIQTAYRRHWKEFKTILWLGATVGVSDLIAAQIIKPWTARLRPCKVEEFVRIVDGCAGSLSFPSNHASNAAAFAVFWLFWRGPVSGFVALGCMAIVGFSRVYLGNHYPSDVVGGFLFGGTIGGLSFLIYRRVFKN